MKTKIAIELYRELDIEERQRLSAELLTLCYRYNAGLSFHYDDGVGTEMVHRAYSLNTATAPVVRPEAAPTFSDDRGMMEGAVPPKPCKLCGLTHPGFTCGEAVGLE